MQSPLFCRVLYNTYYYSMEIFQPFFGYYFVNVLLIILQLLHVFWSCLIIHMVYKFILQGTVCISLYPLHHTGKEGPSRLLENTRVHLAWFLIVLVKLYIYITNSEVEGNSVILGKVDQKKNCTSHYNFGSTSHTYIQQKCGLDFRRDVCEQSQWHMSKNPNTLCSMICIYNKSKKSRKGKLSWLVRSVQKCFPYCTGILITIVLQCCRSHTVGISV